jgi:hypothetical protein
MGLTLDTFSQRLEMKICIAFFLNRPLVNVRRLIDVVADYPW